MFTKLIGKIVEVQIDKNIVKSEDRDIITYGLESSLKQLINVLTTVVLGAFFNLIIESIVFLICFSLIRTYAGGYHCKKALNCYFFSSGIIIFVLLLIKFTPNEFTVIISLILLFISIPVLLKFAPVEALEKPLDDEEKSHFREKMFLNLGLECSALTALFSFGLYTYAYVISLGFLMSAMLVFLGVKQIRN